MSVVDELNKKVDDCGCNFSLIYPNFKIIKGIDEQDILNFEKAARTCYKSEGRICEGSAMKLLRRIVDHGHLAMAEFIDIIIQFQVSRGVSHEMVRHRHLSIGQESQRYVKYETGVNFILPAEFSASCLYHYPNYSNGLFLESCGKSAEMYFARLKAGQSPQVARGSLNSDVATTITIKANLRELLHIISLRCDSPAHPDFRMIMCGFLYYMHNTSDCFDVLYKTEWENWINWFADKFYLSTEDGVTSVIHREDCGVL